MNRSPEVGARSRGGIRHDRIAAFCVAAVAGLALAALAGLAFAKSFTLNVAKNVQVAGKAKNVVVGPSGKTAYTLSGETTHHLLCNSQTCFGFWPPIKVAKNAKLTKAPGVSGKLATLHRNGFYQVTLNGRPLYYYGGDSAKRQANGEGIKAFGGTWHVIAASSASKGANTPTTTTTTTTTSSSTSSSPYCYYPPCP